MSLSGFQQFLSTIVLLLTLGFLVAAIWTAYRRYSANFTEPADPARHRCRYCSNEFPCRNRGPKTKLTEDGHIVSEKVGAGGERRPMGVNEFERKTVYVGSFPIEISQPTNKNCCGVLVQSGLTERFCNFACYRARLKQINST